MTADQKINVVLSDPEVERTLYPRFTPSASPPSGPLQPPPAFFPHAMLFCLDNLLIHPISQCLLRKAPPDGKISSFLLSLALTQGPDELSLAHLSQCLLTLFQVYVLSLEDRALSCGLISLTVPITNMTISRPSVIGVQ